MRFLLVLLVFFPSVVFAQQPSHDVLTFEGVSAQELTELTVAEIKAKYPDKASYLIGIKFLNGLGIKQNTPYIAFQSFLDSGSLYARISLIQMCKRNLCFPDLIEKKLPELIQQAQQYDQAAFSLLYIFANVMKISPELTAKIQNILTPIIASQPGLLYHSAKELMREYPEKFVSILKELDNSYNYTKAQFTLAGVYDEGFLVKKDPTEAFKYFLKASHNGSARASYNVGQSYLIGKTVPQDMEEAYKYISRAADGNDSAALYDLAIFYLHGTIVKKDVPKAIEYLKKAAEKGRTHALSGLGKLAFLGIQDDGTLDTPDYHKAFDLLQSAYQREQIDAAFDLAFFYDTGLNGIKPDHEKAQELYQKVLNSTSVETYAPKAKMYEFGIGVEQNLQNARKFYQDSINAGNIFYKKMLNRVNAKISNANQEAKETAEEPTVEVPEIIKAPKRKPTARPQQQKPTAEQVAYGRRISDQTDFKNKLNETFGFNDLSTITDVDFEKETVTISRPSDQTSVILDITQPEEINRKRRQKVRPFIYHNRVQKWFDKLANASELAQNEYDSTIRHAFPQMVDAAAQLFGYKTISDDGRLTLAIQGKLLPGTTQKEIPGAFVYGYDNDRVLYHRFEHL